MPQPNVYEELRADAEWLKKRIEINIPNVDALLQAIVFRTEAINHINACISYLILAEGSTPISKR